MTFQDLNLSTPILRAITDAGYSAPTPIQAQAIPHILKGKDIIGCAQTGTGKTAAFAIPLLQLINKSPSSKGIRIVVLSPTRELALQISESFTTYGAHMPIKVACIFGGVPQGAQVAKIKQGVDILIATPGRLIDLMQQGYIHLQYVQKFVLDEADRMLDMGFVHDVKRIVKHLPTQRQTLFFSATMPKAIRALADSILNNPVEVSVAPVSSTAETVQQGVYMVEKKEKTALLIGLLKEGVHAQTLVFTRTKHGADKLVRNLSKTGLMAAAIHGNKSQNARQKALNDFKSGTLKVLVATDIAARGIDIDQLPHVVNYELPNVPETYVHRIGRTGRAGAAGVAISFCDSDEHVELNDIEKLIGFAVPVLGGTAVKQLMPRPTKKKPYRPAAQKRVFFQ